MLFPVDAKYAVAGAASCLHFAHGQFWTLVVPKRAMASQLSGEQAQRSAGPMEGACVEAPATHPMSCWSPSVHTQLQQARCGAAVAGRRRASDGGLRLRAGLLPWPPRDERERAFVAGDASRLLFLDNRCGARRSVSHMRPEADAYSPLCRIDTAKVLAA